MERPQPIDFAAINRTAMAHLPSLLARWLPDGHRQGREWVARNPRRHDFATKDKGGDIVSLAAFLSGSGQAEAARNLANMLGIDHG